jgi:hypothetical protein
VPAFSRDNLPAATARRRRCEIAAVTKTSVTKNTWGDAIELYTEVSVGSAALMAFVADPRQELSGGCRNRAIAHERNRLLQVGVKVSVILKMRHLPT